MLSFFRIIKTGFVNFWRNIWLSLAATLVMVITLVILSVLVIMFIITNFSIRSVNEKVDISVFLKTGLAENRVQDIREDLLSHSLVKEVTYITPAEALDRFKEQNKENTLVLESLNELNENPLGGTLQVQAVNLESYPAIAEELNQEKYQSAIDRVSFKDSGPIIERLNRVLGFIITLGLTLVIIFSVIAVLVIFNTITLTIYNRREEVEIMRLVGATNGYIRGPFIIEALMYSLIATLITAGLLVPFYYFVIPDINRFLEAPINIFADSYFTLWNIIAMQFGVALILSVISSLLAIRRYLKI